ncbi:hypothetical protein D3C85_613180 [compost metagenome]
MQVFALTREIVRQPEEDTAVHQVGVRAPGVFGSLIGDKVTLCRHALLVAVSGGDDGGARLLHFLFAQRVGHHGQGDGPCAAEILPVEITACAAIPLGGGQIERGLLDGLLVLSLAGGGKQLGGGPVEFVLQLGVIVGTGSHKVVIGIDVRMTVGCLPGPFGCL